MDKATLPVPLRFFHKFIDFFSYNIIWVKKNLSVIVKPFEVKVFDTDTCPVIGDLETSCVDDVGHFVGRDEFIVLVYEKSIVLPMLQSDPR